MSWLIPQPSSAIFQKQVTPTVVRVIGTASRRSGWTAPVVPWPEELPRCPSIGDLAPSGLDWPIGLVDEPERQRQYPIGLDAYGPHTLSRAARRFR